MLPSCDFLDALKVPLFECKLFGIITFNEANLQVSKSRSILNIFYILVYTSCICYCIYEINTQYSYLIAKATDILILVGNAIFVLTVWISAITTNRHLHIEFLMKLIDVDRKLQSMGIRINYKIIRKKILIKTITRYVILILNISALLFIACYMQVSLIVEFMAYFLIVMTSTFNMHNVELVLMFKTRFIILNKQINNLINTKRSKNFKQLSTLNKVCALHHQLSKLIKTFNQIFGLPLLFMFGVSFMVIVITIFYVTVWLQESEINFILIINPFLANISFIINTLYICHVCYTTIEEVNRTGELIHKIDTEDYNIRDEIEMFSLQIANEQAEFNAAGFFPINYTLIFSIIGGVTTYIIILIQLAASLAG